MRRVFSGQAQVNAWLEEVGFTLDDGKAYWTADTERASYLTITQNTSAVYTDSAGTNNTLANYTSATFCIVEYFELVNGGIAMRFAFGNDSSATIGTPLTYAVVAKEDGSGFVYFFMASATMKYDNLSGVVSIPSYWNSVSITNTNSIAILTKTYDNVDSFIDAHVRSVLAAQYQAISLLYTFHCDGKKYLSGMWINGNAVKSGQLVFEIE